MKNILTEMLGIKYPIFQGGMAWGSDSNLAAAVSNAGGLGIIAGGSAPGEHIRNEIKKAKKLTDKPFGVNIMLMSPNADELSDIVIEEDVKVVTTGAGSPGKYIEKWKNAGIKIFPVIPSVALALRMEKLGVDGVIAEGTESGGHIGELTTMALLPQVTKALKIPVLGAGGIGDGRGVAAAFSLGASGVQCGTCFLPSFECTVSQNYKDLVLKAGDTSTQVTGRSHGHPIRALKNKMMKEYAKLEKEGAEFEKLEELTLGSLKKAVIDGNVNEGSFMAGQIAGLINESKSCKDIIENMFKEAEEVINSLYSLYK